MKVATVYQFICLVMFLMVSPYMKSMAASNTSEMSPTANAPEGYRGKSLVNDTRGKGSLAQPKIGRLKMRKLQRLMPPSDSLRIFLLNPEARLDRNQDAEDSWRITNNFSLGYRHRNWGILGEYQRYSATSSSGLTKIDRTHQEYNLWIERYLYRLWVFDFFGGLGAGMFQESVVTDFSASSYKDTGGFSAHFGVKMGLETKFDLGGVRDLVIIGTEIQSLISGEYDPNPNLALVGKIGVSYGF